MIALDLWWAIDSHEQLFLVGVVIILGLLLLLFQLSLFGLYFFIFLEVSELLILFDLFNNLERFCLLFNFKLEAPDIFSYFLLVLFDSATRFLNVDVLRRSQEDSKEARGKQATLDIERCFPPDVVQKHGSHGVTHDNAQRRRYKEVSEPLRLLLLIPKAVSPDWEVDAEENLEQPSEGSAKH